MPSIVSHPAVPPALASLLPVGLRSPDVIFLGVVCSVLLDLDVVGFGFGVPYGYLLGHRGLSHSIDASRGRTLAPLPSGPVVDTTDRFIELCSQRI